MTETTPSPASPSPNDLLRLFEDMKTRLISVEMLWTRVKQLEIRLDYVETSNVKLNARLSAAVRRRYLETDDPAPESQQEDLPGTTLQAAEEESKRQHLVQKPSAQRQAQQMTTWQT